VTGVTLATVTLTVGRGAELRRGKILPQCGPTLVRLSKWEAQEDRGGDGKLVGTLDGRMVGQQRGHEQRGPRWQCCPGGATRSKAVGGAENELRVATALRGGL
jgi:hypothetical protein